jgi:hypothetical protein
MRHLAPRGRFDNGLIRGRWPASIELIIADGAEEAMVARYATVNDLVVFYRHAPAEEEKFATPTIIKDALESCGRPLLITSGRITVSKVHCDRMERER